MWSYTHFAVNLSHASFVLTNSGSVSGAEVAQLYTTFPESAGESPRQLRGFHKVSLGPGEAATIVLPLSSRGFSIFDVRQHAWKVVIGVHVLMVGASSCDIRARAELMVSGSYV